MDYVMNKYGAKNTCQILAEGTLSCKNVIRRVLSVYGYEETIIKRINSYVPKKLNVTVKDCIEQSEEFNKFFEDRKQILDDIVNLEGLMSHSSTHAAGVIIAPSDVTNYVPCKIDRETGMVVSEWNKKNVEKAGLVKFDLLGLKQLTIFDETLKDIYKNHGVKITQKELKRIDVEDKRIYEYLSKGQFKGMN